MKITNNISINIISINKIRMSIKNTILITSSIKSINSIKVYTKNRSTMPSTQVSLTHALVYMLHATWHRFGLIIQNTLNRTNRRNRKIITNKCVFRMSYLNLSQALVRAGATEELPAHDGEAVHIGSLGVLLTCKHFRRHPLKEQHK